MCTCNVSPKKVLGLLFLQEIALNRAAYYVRCKFLVKVSWAGVTPITPRKPSARKTERTVFHTSLALAFRKSQIALGLSEQTGTW